MSSELHADDAQPVTPPVLIKDRKTEFAESLPVRTLFVICGAIIPVISFLPATTGSHWVNEPWQSGSTEVYFGLLLDWPTHAAFYPILFYSCVSICMLSQDPAHYANKFWIQLGVFAGVLWALTFCVLTYVDWLAVIVMLIVGAIAFTMLWALLMGMKLSRPGLYLGLLSILPAIGWFGGIINGLVEGEPFYDSVVEPLVVPAIVGPVLTFYAYLIAAIVCGLHLKGFKFSLAKLLGATVYLAGAFATWRLAIDRMLIEYSKLPVENPNCFVCTAAAQGHRSWVRSEVVVTQTGNRIQANSQMRWLKAGELIISHTVPQIHRWIRRIYNCLGPKLARSVQRRRWLADACFLLLKPAEWMVRSMFVVCRLPSQTVDRLYR